MTPLPIAYVALDRRQEMFRRCGRSRCQGARYTFLALGLLLLSGCGGQPQVAPANRHLLESLRTAVSAQRSDWLEANAKLLDEQHAAGKLGDTEFTTLQAIIAEAREGRWAEADARVTKLAAGQRVTAEDLSRLKAQRPAQHP